MAHKAIPQSDITKQLALVTIPARNLSPVKARGQVRVGQLVMRGDMIWGKHAPSVYIFIKVFAQHTILGIVAGWKSEPDV